ncbi:23S rRNA pseudouridylate synthase [Vibrio harveyi]|uniref:23S rRNA pseudouridine(1911/1915/1917) synthase RluD n=1 Tax=Vibrio harveyi TaxID=669 RepID=UPI000539567A|nr:23S rRNA pseudouridine(1911/1915/1917) synthase RluD [Vibrio harveyi]AIV04605.1 23S rRNA pseudouridylate synthase [Vibrio harveyi]
MAQQIVLTNTVKDSQLGQRLDQAIAELFADFSRSRLKEWLLDGKVQVNGEVVTKPRTKVMGGEEITLQAELEDEDIIVINKPRDFVVHPGAGTPDGTVLNALLHHYPDIAEVPRAGIVHRLDKDTTGLMVVAKTVPAQTRLVRALQKRNITREYEAIAIGRMTAGGKVDQPIGRHSTKRTLMAVAPLGKPAVTHYRVAEHFREHTRIRLRLETGRTHQIRVHMSYLQHPLLGDTAYGGRARIPTGASEELTAMIRGFDRQALHAVMLRFEHPITGEELEFHAPVPDDMVKMTEALRKDTEEFGLPDEF